MNNEDTRTALCIYEYIIFAIQNNNNHLTTYTLQNIQNTKGIAELRELSMELAPSFNKAFDDRYPQAFDGPFDIDFIPLLLDKAIDISGAAFTNWPVTAWLAAAEGIWSDNTTGDSNV